MAHILAIDTATPLCGVALLRSDGQPFVRRARVTTHSETLFSLLDDCMAAADVRPADLTAIACSAGPGSFTGLRIGLSTAKGLCFALDRPLLLISSLHALAAATAARDGHALAVLDAFRGQLFARLLPAPGQPVPNPVATALRADPRLASDGVWSPSDLTAALAPLAGSLILCSAGPLPPHAAPLASLAQRIVVDDVTAPNGRHLAPHDGTQPPSEPPPVTLARLALDRLAAGDVADLHAAVPNYICASAPEQAEAERARLAAQPSA